MVSHKETTMKTPSSLISIIPAFTFDKLFMKIYLKQTLVNRLIRIKFIIYKVELLNANILN